jgi:hypothetical protein
MSSNQKPKQAFPGRTGMGIESGLTKLEYVAALIYSGNNEHCTTKDAVERAVVLLKLCAEKEKESQ